MLVIACASPQQEASAVRDDPQQFAQLSVVPGAATLAVGDSTTLEAIALNGALDTVASPSVSWRSANEAIATVSSAGVVTAHATGLAGIAAEGGGKVAVARIVVVPKGQRPVLAQQPPPAPTPSPPVQTTPREARTQRDDPQQNPRTRPLSGPDSGVEPPPAHERPNEPPGFRPINNRPFRSKAESAGDRGRDGSEGWSGTEARYRKFSIVRDPTAPTGDSSVGQMLYTADHRAGTGPATATIYFPPGLKELYLSIWAKISENWVGNQSNTNKMFFLGVAKGNNQFFFSAEGSGRERLEAQLRLQGVLDKRGRIRPNITPAEVRRGEWQHWEFVFRCGQAPGTGSIDLWINGQHVTSVQNVNWTRSRRPEEPCEMSMLNWNPTYGGGGASPGVDQWLRFDRVYISGR